MLLKISGFLFAAILTFISFSLNEITVMNKVNNGFISDNAVYFKVQSDLPISPNEMIQALDKKSVLYKNGMDSNNFEVVGFGGEATCYPLQSGRQFRKQDLDNNEKILSISGVNSTTRSGEVLGRIGFSFPSLMDYMNFSLLPCADRSVLHKGIYLIDGSSTSIQRSYIKMMSYFTNIEAKESITLLDIKPQGTYRMLNQQTALHTIMVLTLLFIFFSFIGVVIYWLQKKSDLILLFILFGYRKIKIFNHLSKIFLQQTIPVFVLGNIIAVVGLTYTHGGQLVSSVPWRMGEYLLILFLFAEAIIAIRIVKRG